jgi:exopolyphosphatase/guanosine-5'-triphosphate,3'-diphosphate pyrophosphatase
MTVRLGDNDTLVDVDEHHHVIPIGVATLASTELVSDPPRPEELTNAIGLVVDHLDDLLRAVPAARDADEVAIVGDLATVIAAVDFGGTPPLPFPLTREAVEDGFRTVATETSAERALNPGLPASAVGTIVAACCIVVALMRHLHLDRVDVRSDVEAQP